MTRITPIESGNKEMVFKIEEACFRSAWSRESLSRTLDNPRITCLLALTDTGDAAGYALSLRVDDEAELLKIAVLPEHREKGIAERLLKDMAQELRACGALSLHLEVRESNRAARALYSKAGFRHVGIRRHYYTAPAEDAIVMSLSLRQ